MSRSVDAARRMYDAVNRQDAEALLALMHPEVRFWEPESLPHGGTYEGHAGIGEFLGRLAEHYEGDMSLRAETILDAGDTAVTLGRFAARVKETGVRIDVPLAEVVRVEDGLIREIRVYPDTATMVSALGRPAATA